jgi:pimeloyl-ACP methyl ester carboxylesterase
MPASPALERFEVHVPEDVLADLRARIHRTAWPDQPADVTWELGVDGTYLRGLAAAWADEFDWTAAAARLNGELPGWRARVGEHTVHVALVPPASPSPLGGPTARPPVVLLHGWPSSYCELLELAPRLADPGRYGGDPADAVPVVVPSLPGHGFSSIPPRTGFGADECADVLRDLLVDVLGLGRFVVHGGDRGAFVATSLGHRHPDVVAGIHLTLPTGIPGIGEDRTADESRWLADTAAWSAEEGGYSAIQGTRPQTLAYAMHDSPVGMLAWIVEKFRAWSDCGGDVESRFSRDLLLTNATIYWVTGTFRAASHWYWEHRQRPPAAARPVRVEVPTGVAAFPGEVMRTPRSAVARKYDLVHWTDMSSGGHFPALEEPDLLAADIRAFLRRLAGGTVTAPS